MTTGLTGNDTCSLRDLTGQESGIIVYPGVILLFAIGLNWRTTKSSAYFADFNYDRWITDDLYSEACDIGDKIIWDLNGDMFDIANNDKPVKATVYKFNDNVYVFAQRG